jgi:uncharacterized protein (DUF2336 family)
VSQRVIEAPEVGDKSEVAELIINLHLSRELLPAILDLQPLEEFLSANFMQCLICLQRDRVRKLI